MSRTDEGWLLLGGKTILFASDLRLQASIAASVRGAALAGITTPTNDLFGGVINAATKPGGTTPLERAREKEKLPG